MKKHYNIFLDDERKPTLNTKYLRKINGFGALYIIYPWFVITNFEDFKKMIIENGLPHRISFDHDLGSVLTNPKEKDLKRKNQKSRIILPSGMDCAKWLIDYCIENNIKLTTEIKVHSANPIGANNIRTLITNFKKLFNNNSLKN